MIHDAGYVHNDLKPSNIMFDYYEKLHIIDFGCATSYREKLYSRQHILEGPVEKFYGNIQFASINQLGFRKTSRRDDVISLLYILVYLLNGIKVAELDPKMSLQM